MVGSLPHFQRVNVEITNVCNLRCSFCAPSARPPQRLSVPAFRGLAEQLVGLTDEVVLHVLGEPLTHPDLANILAAAAAVGLPVHVVSNGVLLAAEPAELMLQPIVRQVSVSLQSAADGLPEAGFAEYLERVLAFCDRAASQRPDLYLNLRLWGAQGPYTGIDDVRLAERLSQHFGRDLRSLQVDVRRRKNVPLRGRQYLHFDSRFTWPRLDLPEGNAAGTCHGLSGHFGILADGTVVPCCLDAEGVLALGNAFTTPLLEILQSERAQRLRAGFAVGRRVEALCRRCSFVERFSRQRASAKPQGHSEGSRRHGEGRCQQLAQDPPQRDPEVAR
jgi:MoaA/NifB/PqqE/SkfB family radical SAM enzyme